MLISLCLVEAECEVSMAVLVERTIRYEWRKPVIKKIQDVANDKLTSECTQEHFP